MMYFTSDWHIGHDRSIELDNRPFRDMDHMCEVLVNNYNACVGEADTCFFLGDMGWLSGTLLQDTVRQLNGRKVIILGNHDGNATAMQKRGFDLALYTASLVVGGQIVTLSHCPLRGVFREVTAGMRGALPGENWHGETRHRRFSVDDFGQFHLHGHTHKGSEYAQIGRQWDVGVPGNKYRPVSQSQVEAWISQQLNR